MKISQLPLYLFLSLSPTSPHPLPFSPQPTSRAATALPACQPPPSSADDLPSRSWRHDRVPAFATLRPRVVTALHAHAVPAPSVAACDGPCPPCAATRREPILPAWRRDRRPPSPWGAGPSLPTRCRLSSMLATVVAPPSPRGSNKEGANLRGGGVPAAADGYGRWWQPFFFVF